MIEFHGYSLLKAYLKKDSNILELGNQVMNLAECQGVSAKKYFTDKGHRHTSIDINGKDGALKLDLTKSLDLMEEFDIVTDFGTIEHTGNLYPVLKNIFKHCKKGGIMLHKNPKTGNFPLHGNFYFTITFWAELAKVMDYKIHELYEHPIYHNITDGWEVIAVMESNGGKFISQYKFNRLLKHVYDK